MWTALLEHAAAWNSRVGVRPGRWWDIPSAALAHQHRPEADDMTIEQEAGRGLLGANLPVALVVNAAVPPAAVGDFTSASGPSCMSAPLTFPPTKSGMGPMPASVCAVARECAVGDEGALSVGFVGSGEVPQAVGPVSSTRARTDMLA